MFYPFQNLCEPRGYTPMLHKDYAEDLRHFRSRSKSWSGGAKRRVFGQRLFWGMRNSCTTCLRKKGYHVTFMPWTLLKWNLSAMLVEFLSKVLICYNMIVMQLLKHFFVGWFIYHLLLLLWCAINILMYE